MKILDYYLMSINNIKGNKKSFLRNSILIGISLSILTLSSIATSSINNVLEKNIKNNLSYRSIYVTNYENIDQKTFIKNIEEIKNVAKAIPQEAYSTNIDIDSIDGEKSSGALSLIGSDNDISPQIIAGRKIEKNEKNVCIVPKKFQPQNLENSTNDNEIIDGEDLLNKEIEIVYHNYDYSKEYPQRINTIKEKYRVVGVYDQEINMGEYYECYINFEDVLKIQNEITKNSNYINEFDPILAIVDNSENVEPVMNELKKLGYNVLLRSVPNTELIDIIESICTVLSICTMIIALSNIIINVIKTAEERKYELGLLKAFGYNKRNLWYSIIMESVITAITGFILSCIFVSIVVGILYLVLQNASSELRKIKFIIGYKTFLYSFFMALIISMFGNVIASYNIANKATVIKNIKK